MYEHATAYIQTNGALPGPIPFHSALRQGCPLSMALYALCIHPLLRTLEDRLTGINIGKRGQRISVLAYADDITVFLTHREDIEKVNQAIWTYEQATGAQLNLNNSRALAVGGWAEPITPLGIDLLPQVKILGVTFGSTVDATVQESWSTVDNAVRAQARQAYARHLCLAHRVQYVQTYLLSKIWYLAQVLPPPIRHIQQLTTTCTWFIWRGATFRVPTTTLQRPKNQGGWALPEVALKCRALLLGRMRTLAAQKTSATAAFLRTWNLTDVVENPLKYVEYRANSPTSANMPWTWLTYRPLARMNPSANCEAGYTGLAAINRSETNLCSTCGEDDTIQRRLTQCGASKLVWNWTRERIAAITSTNPLDVPEEWAVRPDFHIRPPQMHKAIMWMLAHLVDYHIQGQRRISLLDYIDFMRQARWKADSRSTRRTAVGSYLTVL